MKKGLRRLLRFLTVMIALTMSVSSQGAVTAAQQLNSAVAKWLRGDITATFVYSGSAGKGTGTLKSSGTKFALQSSVTSVWYNGSNMWTYSPSTKETTLVKPSASEVAESNPVAVLSGSAAGFSASFAKKQTAGTSTIIMTPKSNKSGLKRVVVVLQASTLKPLKIDVTSADGSRNVLTIKSIATGQKHSATTFNYPSGKYPKVKVVDLR